MSKNPAPSKKLRSAVAEAKRVNAIDPGRYKMVKKGNKEVPVYVAKLERELKRRCTEKNHITGLQCGNPPIKGSTVCHKHGGQLPPVKLAAAQRIQDAKNRLLDELDPTISRLKEIRDQDDHLPSALGASVQILNRTIGKPEEGKRDESAKRTIIKIGVAIGGIPTQPVIGLLAESTEESESHD